MLTSLPYTMGGGSLFPLVHVRIGLIYLLVGKHLQFSCSSLSITIFMGILLHAGF